MLITKVSELTNISRTREIQITEEQYQNWLQNREPIQNFFPFLSDDDREFLMTGITPEEWNNAFME